MALNLEALKKAASRVQEYLGAKHKIRLPISSALEVVALAHGARNWQTLQARGGLGAQNGPTAQRIPVDWHYASGEAMHMSLIDWRRHAAVLGLQDVRNTWAGLQLDAHLREARGALVLSMTLEELSFYVVGTDISVIHTEHLRAYAQDQAPLGEGSRLRQLARSIVAGGVWALPFLEDRQVGRTQACCQAEDLLVLAVLLEAKVQNNHPGISILMPNYCRYAPIKVDRLTGFAAANREVQLGFAYSVGDGLRHAAERGRAYGVTCLVGVKVAAELPAVLQANLANTILLSASPSGKLDDGSACTLGSPEAEFLSLARREGRTAVVAPHEIRISREGWRAPAQ